MYAGIRDIFKSIANPREELRPVLLKEVYISSMLYQYLRNLHRDMVNFTGKLGQVMEHGTHRDFMKKGRAEGYTMPDQKAFERRLLEFQLQLESYDPANARTIRKTGNGGEEISLVCVPASVARGFLCTGLQSAEFLAHFIEVLNESEYFKLLRKMKEENRPYQGPHSILEYFLASVSMQMAAGVARHEASCKPMPSNWVDIAPPSRISSVSVPGM